MRVSWRQCLPSIFLVCLTSFGQNSSPESKSVSPKTPSATIASTSDFEFQFEGLDKLAKGGDAPHLKKILIGEAAKEFTAQIARVFAAKGADAFHYSAQDPEYAKLIEKLMLKPFGISGSVSKNGLEKLQIVAESSEQDSTAWLARLSTSIKNGKAKVDAIQGTGFSKVDQERGKSFSFGYTNGLLVIDFGDASSGLQSRLPAKGQMPLSGLRTNLAHLRLSGEFAHPFGLKAKVAEFRVSPQGESLRTVGTIVPEKAISSAAQKFVVPEIIHDPLLSFFAVQKVDELFALPPYLAELGLALHTNQVFGWSVSGLPFQSFLVTEFKGSRKFLHDVGPKAMVNLAPRIKQAGLGELMIGTNDSLTVKGTQFVVPTLESMEADGHDYLFGSIFPFAISKDAFPKELMQELDPAKKLVYYDWEITDSRFSHWQLLNSISPIFRLDHPTPVQQGPVPGNFNFAQMRWLPLLEKQLGNTVTEISLKSPEELAFVRKSQVGFSSMELIALSQWFASRDPSKEVPSNPMPTPQK